MKILLVDDESGIVVAYKAALFQHEVNVARTLGDGLALLQDLAAVDVILLDIVLPDFSSKLLCDFLVQAHLRHNSAAIVLITGHELNVEDTTRFASVADGIALKQQISSSKALNQLIEDAVATRNARPPLSRTSALAEAITGFVTRHSQTPKTHEDVTSTPCYLGGPCGMWVCMANLRHGKGQYRGGLHPTRAFCPALV